MLSVKIVFLPGICPLQRNANPRRNIGQILGQADDLVYARVRPLRPDESRDPVLNVAGDLQLKVGLCVELGREHLSVLPAGERDLLSP